MTDPDPGILDTIKAEIAAALKSARNSARDDDDAPPADKNAMQRRITELTAEKRTLTTQIEGWGVKFATLETSTQKTISDLRADAQKQAETLTARYKEDLTLHDAGATDDLKRIAIRQAWQAEPKETRGESAGAWWTGLREAAKDPEKAKTLKVHDLLRPLLPELAGGNDDKTKGKQPGGIGGNDAGTQRGGQKITVEEIRALAQRAKTDPAAKAELERIRDGR